MPPTPKLSDAQRAEIRQRWASGQPRPTLRFLATEYDVSHETIRKAVRDLIQDHKVAKAARRALLPPRRPLRLSEAQKAAIRHERLQERTPLVELAKRYGVSRSLMQRVTRSVVPTQLLTDADGRRSGGRARHIRAPGVSMPIRRQIVAERDRGAAYGDLAARFRVSVNTVKNIVDRRDLIPTVPHHPLRGRVAMILSLEQREAITSLWLDGLTPAQIADRVHAPRDTVRAFAQKLKTRGGWLSSVYVRRCLRCHQLFSTPRRHARLHGACSQGLDSNQRRALRAGGTRST